MIKFKQIYENILLGDTKFIDKYFEEIKEMSFFEDKNKTHFLDKIFISTLNYYFYKNNISFDFDEIGTNNSAGGSFSKEKTDKYWMDSIFTGGRFSRNGEINIDISETKLRKLIDKEKENWLDIFKDKLKLVINHEFVHKAQNKNYTSALDTKTKKQNYFKDAKKTGFFKNRRNDINQYPVHHLDPKLNLEPALYMATSNEIMAYAQTFTEEVKNNVGQILDWFKKGKIKNIYDSSAVFRRYYDFFKLEPKIYRRFLKYCYLYLIKLKKSQEKNILGVTKK